MVALVVILMAIGCSRRSERSVRKVPTGIARKVLIRGVNQPVSVAVDGTGVYWDEWTDGDKRRLRRLDVNGAETTIADGLTAGAGKLVATHGFIYWAEGYRGVRRILREGGTPEDVALSTHGDLEFVVDGDGVIWSDNDQDNGALWRKDPGRLAVPLARGRIGNIKLSGGWVYFFHVMDDTLRRVFATGGKEETLLRNCRWADFAVDASGIYVSCDFDDTGLRRLSLVGGTPVVIAPHQAGRDLTVDAANVYWSSGIEGSIRRMSKNGGPIEDVVKIGGGKNHIFGFTVHEGAVYWTDFRDRTVEMVRL